MSVPFEKYAHPEDIKYLKSLKALPLFDVVMRKFLATFNEVTFRTLYLGSAVKVSERQQPSIHEMLCHSCGALGIDEPELFLCGRAEANAFTFGETHPMIVLNAGLLYRVNEDELKTVIAHECGHIAGKHVLYHNLGNLILSGAGGFFGNLLTAGFFAELFKWMRASEYSCDRAASVVMGSGEPVQTGLLKFATGSASLLEPVNMEECLRQADELDKYTDDMWVKVFSFYSLTSRMSHPFLAYRVRELKRWTESKQYMELFINDDGERLDGNLAGGRIKFG